MSTDDQVAKIDKEGAREDLPESPIQLVSRALLGDRYSAKKNTVYLNAFYLSEELIKEMDERAKEAILEQPILSGSTVYFKALVRFDDCSSQEFVEMSRALRRAADVRDPESVVFSWRVLVAGHGGMISSVECSFVTEKRMRTGSVGAFDFSTASMSLEVYGGDEKWVAESFNKVSGILTSAKLPWIYAPLLIFRNKILVQIVSQFLGMSAFFVFTDQATILLRDSSEQGPSSILTKALSSKDLGEKIDDLVRFLLLPSHNAWWNVIVILGGGLVVYLVSFFILMKGLPRLVPRSIIAIGLIKHRLLFWSNVLKFIFLSVGVSGILLPLVKRIFSAALKFIH